MSNLKNSTNFYQEDTFDKDSWFKIAIRDYQKLLKTEDFNAVFKGYGESLSLLDIGCGTGKFPSMLQGALDQDYRVNYDLLDPSAYCLDECAKILKNPFFPARKLQTTMEDMEHDIPEGTQYDLIWAIQSFYCAALEQLPVSLQKAYDYLTQNGVFYIFQADQNSTYMQLQDLYIRNLDQNSQQNYVTANQIEYQLKSLGFAYEKKVLSFHHEVPVNDESLLEKYINQCAFGDKPLAEWMADPACGAWINQHKGEEFYRFAQNVWLLAISKS